MILTGMSRHSMAKLDSLLGGRVEWRAFWQLGQKGNICNGCKFRCKLGFLGYVR